MHTFHRSPQPFTATELLLGQDTNHEIQHELESLFWVVFITSDRPSEYVFESPSEDQGQTGTICFRWYLPVSREERDRDLLILGPKTLTLLVVGESAGCTILEESMNVDVCC